MALDYSLADIKDFRSLCYYEKDGATWMTPTTETVIFSCMVTRIGEITEKNWTEWYARYQTWSLLVTGDRPTLSPQDVYNHIGLKTNVFPELTRHKWVKQYVFEKMNAMAKAAQRQVNDLNKQVEEIQELLG